MVVDMELPDGDGLELLEFVRDAGNGESRVDPGLPLILTSLNASPLDRMRGLERGCDDYLPRRYAYTELRARIAALLRRRHRLAINSRIRVGTLEVDALSRQAWVGGEQVLLSSKEFSLLHALAREPGRVFKRAELMAMVWGWSDGSHAAHRTRTLDSHASRLRRKLAAHGASYVINVWAVGYRLIDLKATVVADAEQLVA